MSDFLLFIGAVKLTVSERSNDDVTQTDNDMKTLCHVIKTFIWTYDVILHTSNNYSLWSVTNDYSLDYFNYTETFQHVSDLCLTLKEFVNIFHRLVWTKCLFAQLSFSSISVLKILNLLVSFVLSVNKQKLHLFKHTKALFKMSLMNKTAQTLTQSTQKRRADKCSSGLPSYLSLLLFEPEGKKRASDIWLFLCETPRERKGQTHRELPERFLSKPSRFLSVKDGL